MNKGRYIVSSNQRISSTGVWKMILHPAENCVFPELRPGQFVNIALKGHYLRRPISVCDWDSKNRSITLVYKTVGAGTRDMSTCLTGTELDLLAGLGNGFPIEGKRPLLVGGGVGMPPMLALARAFLKSGIAPVVVGGFASVADVILEDDFSALGIELLIATMDGSRGVAGTVLEHVRKIDADCIYACGPKPMLKALSKLPQPAYLSVEERMGCGYGVCMGCNCPTVDGYKRVCKAGPVFRKEDLVW